jgi:hypothetical protein
MGFTSPVSGNHSFRVLNKKWMWITPSGIPRYNLHEEDLVKVLLFYVGMAIGPAVAGVHMQSHQIYVSTVVGLSSYPSAYSWGDFININRFSFIFKERKPILKANNQRSGTSRVSDYYTFEIPS